VLQAALASSFAQVALANVEREFPRRLDQLRIDLAAEWRPRALHPAFYGSYDWHSAVHMHWLLARVLRLHPDLPERSRVESLLERHLTASAMKRERAFFSLPGGATFERPYGWAWLLELQAELLRLGCWHEAAEPLAEELAKRLAEYLRGSPYPVRSGAHANTAFACVLALDYAEAAADPDLRQAIDAAARRWYWNDRAYPVAYEPSADDFLSPALIEAVLMKAVLTEAEFSEWLSGFLPRELGPLAEPPRVVDHADAKQSHLDGLCLSRAWCFFRLGNFEVEARRHLQAGMPHVVGGDYVGEHWLASFAMLALSAEALRSP
jgi:Protein of unknown function (DUF2891)